MSAYDFYARAVKGVNLEIFHKNCIVIENRTSKLIVTSLLIFYMYRDKNLIAIIHRLTPKYTKAWYSCLKTDSYHLFHDYFPYTWSKNFGFQFCDFGVFNKNLRNIAAKTCRCFENFRSEILIRYFLICGKNHPANQNAHSKVRFLFHSFSARKYVYRYAHNKVRFISLLWMLRER